MILAVILAGAALTNTHSVLRFDACGRIVSVEERATCRELLSRPTPFLELRLSEGKSIAADRMALRKGEMVFRFSEGDAEASLRSESFGDGHSFRISSARLPGNSELRVGCIAPAPCSRFGKAANLASDESSGVCVRPYEIFATIDSGPELMYATIPSGKAVGARFGVVAAPLGSLRGALQAMTLASGRPHSSAGGPWACGGDAARGSYMNADVSAKNLDVALAMAERGGFGILHFREGWYGTAGWRGGRGHYPVNTNNWPGGLADMKAAVAKIHAAGLRAGLHTLTGCIETDDPWVSGPENSQLFARQTYTLAADISADASELTVTEAPKGRHDTVSTYSSWGNSLRIGNEIVQYSDFTRDPPYRYTGLVRGAFGTKAASHASGSEVAYLQQRYLAFCPNPDTPLADKVADAIADVYNACGFDMVYCDGTEGMGTIYGMAAMRDKIVARCVAGGRPCINEDSTSGHPDRHAQSWWFTSRVGAWDSCKWAPKQFHDLHVERMMQLRESEFLEVQMGWWRPLLLSRGGLAERSHTVDVMEYFASRNAGMDASMSVFSEFFADRVVPFSISRLMTVLGWWERARLARAFRPGLRERFDRKGAEFRLRQNRGSGEWEISPVESFYFRSASPESANFSVGVSSAPEKTALRISALTAGDRPNGTNVVDLTNGTAAKDLVLSSAGAEVAISAEDSRADDGRRAFRLAASNSGMEPRGAWARASVVYSPHLAIGNSTVLRFRVKGDGSGALLNVQLETPREHHFACSEHYVTLDFVGWRDFEMPMRERDAARSTDYSWPYNWNYAPVFCRFIHRDHVSALNFYLNDIRKGGRCVAEVSDVALTPERTIRLKNVAVAVNDETSPVPFDLESGNFAELEDGFWTLYSADGEPLRRRRAEFSPRLVAGSNKIAYRGKTEDGSWPRACIEVFSVGSATPAFKPVASLPAEARRIMLYEAVEPRLYAPARGFDSVEPVVVRPGETARIEVSAVGPSPAFELRVGNAKATIPAVDAGDFRTVVLDGEHRGACPVSVRPVTPSDDFSVRLEFVKRYAVLLAPGTKELDSTMEISPADCGKVFASADQANPTVLSGGRTIKGWQVGDDGVWRVTLPEVKSGKWNFSQLFVNGERRRRPCVPTEGFHFTTDNAYTNEPGMPFCGFVYNPTNVAVRSDYANMNDIEVEVFYNWSVAKMRLAGIDLENRRVRFTSGRKLSKKHSTHARPRRWRLENVKEAFGRAGEWYLDRPTGVLSYKPLPGETPENCHVVAPYLKQILRVVGENGKPVKDVVFRNIRFRCSNVIVPDDGAYTVQGELDVPAALELTRAENVRFESCAVESVGGWAVAFGPGCYGNAVDSCLLQDLGAGGVKLGAPYAGYTTIDPNDPDPDRKYAEAVPGFEGKAWDLTGDTRIENCRMVHGGQVFHAGMGVLAGRTFGAKILHNEIAHFDYTAISVGWDWGNKVTMAHDNEVAFNHCWDLGRRVLSDMGIVYTLGKQPGTTIHDNHLHGIDVWQYGGKGIYLDECTSHVKVFNNLVYDTRCSHSQSFTVGCEIYNNIFYCPKRGPNLLWRSKAGSDDVAMNAHHNIIVWDDESEAFERCNDFTATPEKLREEELRRPSPAAGSKLDYNVYWKIGSTSTNGLFRPKRYAGNGSEHPYLDFRSWQEMSGGDSHSVFADPKFENAAAFDFRLRGDSPAPKLGFKPFDYRRAGLSSPSRVPAAGALR